MAVSDISDWPNGLGLLFQAPEVTRVGSMVSPTIFLPRCGRSCRNCVGQSAIF